jgi:predicted ATPase/class 3 adenylate cyclase
MPELPTGTVTFLFTDIEGSTRLLQELGSEYTRLQDQHASIIRTAVADGGGVVIRTEGDAFFAVFPSPSGALRSAVASQRELASFPWADGRRILVRMGLHTGEGTLGGDDYVGIDVNRAARIAATGHGGQVVISETTLALVADGLPEGVAVRDLGTHRLKDIEHPEHLHDLVIQDLVSDFPTLRSLGSQRTNLPSPRTSFVGRSREIVEVGELLDSTRLLTLTGPGGTGKTRLALKVAWERVDRYRDGVYFVDLSPVTERALVIPEIARAVRVREVQGRDPAATLREHLRGRELLLVLDNLERLIPASPVVGTLLDAAPDLTVLATSRIPLRLSGEQEYPVSPLALPEHGEAIDVDRLRACESVQLFIERATAVRPGLRITDESAPTLLQIVSRLDGLPLALELAGSKMRVLGLDALAQRLERRLPLLTGGARDTPERQRTLEGTIEWSYELLEPDEKGLFARLSVFAGGWSLEAAEAVCGTDLDVLEGLGSLVDDSLVRRIELHGGGLRFTMLETIREFAAARLAADEQERETLQGRHAEFFRDIAERAEPYLTGEEQATWLEILELESDNLRAALDRAERASDALGTENGLRTASAIWRFWQQRGRMPEGRSILERLLAQPAAQRRDAVRARALAALGSIAYWQTDHERVPPLYREALEIAREVGDRRLLAQALLNLSFVQDFTPRGLEERTALLEESLAVSGDGDLFLQGQIWTAFGYLRLFVGDKPGAAERIERALAVQRKSGDRFGLSESLSGLAGLAFDAGDIQEMRRRLGEATAIVAESSSPINLCTVLLPYARIANHEGRHRDAARLVGAYNRVEEDYDVHIPPVGVQFLGDPGEHARAELGDEAFELARQEGFALSLEQVFAFVAREASAGEPSNAQ